MNIANNVASILAHQRVMDSSANNIANISSNNFVPTNTRVVGGENSLRVQSTLADSSGSSVSQTDLSKEVLNQIVVENATALNVVPIRVQDEMLGTLLDIKG